MNLILQIDLQTGEVRDPAIGIVGKVTWTPKNEAPWMTVVIEVDVDKLNQKRSEAIF